MATYSYYMPFIERGENPYYSFLTPVLTGQDTINIYAGDQLKVPNIWDVLLAGLDVDTDANAGNRFAIISVVGPMGVTGSLAYVSSPAIVASQTGVNTYINTFNVLGGSATTALEYYLGLSQRVPLIGKQGRITLFLNAGKAGDTIQAKLVLKFKNHELGMLTQKEKLDGVDPLTFARPRGDC